MLNFLGGSRGSAGALTRPSTRHLLPKNFEKTALRKRGGIFAVKMRGGHNCGNYCTSYWEPHRHMCSSISTKFPLICPPFIFTVNMPTLFLRAVFSKFFGRRCLVEGLVSAPAHPLPPPKNVSTPGLKKWQDSQIHILP